MILPISDFLVTTRTLPLLPSFMDPSLCRVMMSASSASDEIGRAVMPSDKNTDGDGLNLIKNTSFSKLGTGVGLVTSSETPFRRQHLQSADMPSYGYCMILCSGP